jgi:hypothetical protein
MSGYFSRIARQGGAHIAGDGGQRAGTPAAKTESHFAPIDHAETVMVSPRASSDVPASRRHKSNVDSAVQNQARGQKMARQSTSAIDPAIENSRGEVKRPIPLEPVREEIKLIEPEATRRFSQVPVSLSPTPDEKQIEPLKSIAMDESAKKIPAGSSTAETAKSTEKTFFEKTVEIVEGQTAKPTEVHTILLREVQEWIAAGQTIPEDVTTDTSMPSEREPGVVRIADGRAKPVQEVSTTNFTEQVFELSIGAISVVVEGDERAPAPASAQVATSSAGRETPQRFSRLSRHYL